MSPTCSYTCTACVYVCSCNVLLTIISVCDDVVVCFIVVCTCTCVRVIVVIVWLPEAMSCRRTQLEFFFTATTLSSHL